MSSLSMDLLFEALPEPPPSPAGGGDVSRLTQRPTETLPIDIPRPFERIEAIYI